MATDEHKDIASFKSQSLVKRILIASLVLLPVALGFGALLINRAYVNSLKNAEEASLFAQTYALIESGEPSEDTLELPPALANPLFETPGSGLYARVYGATPKHKKPSEDKADKSQSNDVSGTTFGETFFKETLVWQSNSAEATILQVSDATKTPLPGLFIREEVKVNQRAFQRFRFSTIWEIGDQDEIFVFEILSSLEQRNKDIAAYRRILFAWLAGMTLLLIAIQILIVRWGLIPITTLAQEVRAIESGQQKSIDNLYPPELTPLADNLNTLLITEEKQRERYKNTLANLAHSLKTPLAVIRSHLSNKKTKKINVSGGKSSFEPDIQKLNDINGQIDRMSEIISHQLQRASRQSSIVTQAQCNFHSIAQRLGSALSKVYADKEPVFENLLPAKWNYPAEENDIMELFGNLLENAFKYGNGWVKISVEQKTASNIDIAIEDNGEGISDELAPHILVRGARADTTQHGQGIGLSVAAELLSHYGGGLSIQKASLRDNNNGQTLGNNDKAGAKFVLSFPVKG